MFRLGGGCLGNSRCKTQQMQTALGREQSTIVNHEMLLFSKQSQMLQLWVSDK